MNQFGSLVRIFGLCDAIYTLLLLVAFPFFLNTGFHLKAVVFESTGEQKSYEFIRDFVCKELSQKDVNDFWVIEYPMELLHEYSKDLKLGTPEPRLIGEVGEQS